MLHAVLSREIVERLTRGCTFHSRVDLFQRTIGQEHDTRLRPHLHDVARTIVFFVAPRALVLLDQVSLVFVDRKTASQPGLFVAAHAQAVKIERGRLVHHERRSLAQLLKVLARALVDAGGVRIRIGWKVDFGAGHPQKAERIVACQLTRFLGADDVVGDGGNSGRARGNRPQGTERMDRRHPRILVELMRRPDRVWLLAEIFG